MALVVVTGRYSSRQLLSICLTAPVGSTAFALKAQASDAHNSRLSTCRPAVIPLVQEQFAGAHAQPTKRDARNAPLRAKRRLDAVSCEQAVAGNGSLAPVYSEGLLDRACFWEAL